MFSFVFAHFVLQDCLQRTARSSKTIGNTVTSSRALMRSNDGEYFFYRMTSTFPSSPMEDSVRKYVSAACPCCV